MKPLLKAFFVLLALVGVSMGTLAPAHADYYHRHYHRYYHHHHYHHRHWVRDHRHPHGYWRYY